MLALGRAATALACFALAARGSPSCSAPPADLSSGAADGVDDATSMYQLGVQPRLSEASLLSLLKEPTVRAFIRDLVEGEGEEMLVAPGFAKPKLCDRVGELESSVHSLKEQAKLDSKQLHSLKEQVAALQAKLDSQGSAAPASCGACPEVVALNAKVAALETQAKVMKLGEGALVLNGTDLVVVNANIRVFSEHCSNVGHGNLVVGLGHTYTNAANSFAAGSKNTVEGCHASVTGGSDNHASSLAVVAGGSRNSATNKHAVVAGGLMNVARGEEAAVFGGFSNSAAGMFAVVAGGDENSVAGETGTIVGGHSNSIHIGAEKAVVAGGQFNSVFKGKTAGVFGGGFNQAGGYRDAAILGGRENIVNGSGVGDAIVGGYGNFVDVRAVRAFVTQYGEDLSFDQRPGYTISGSVLVGGLRNVARGINSLLGVAVGGAANHVEGKMPVVVGGSRNHNEGFLSVIASGASNSITSSGLWGAILGGHKNTVDHDLGLTAGGYSNSIEATGAFVVGDSRMTAKGMPHGFVAVPVAK